MEYKTKLMTAEKPETSNITLIKKLIEAATDLTEDQKKHLLAGIEGAKG